MDVFDPKILRHISPDNIPKYLARLHQGMVLSNCKHESLVPGIIKDLEWNFYDESHRQFVHNTYDDMYKVMAGKYFSVNMVRWKNLPIFFQVANAKIADGLFYQSMTILGILCVHQVVRFTQKEAGKVLLQVDWWTASHWLFKWLHKPFNKRLMHLQKKQDYEDNVLIRGRRFDLRCKGFRFGTDEPDFINSNTLTNNVSIPAFNDAKFVNLCEYSINTLHRITCGPVELMFKKLESKIEIWPGICPHEGAALTPEHICKEIAHCPWHGRTFRKVVLDEQKTLWHFLGVDVFFSDSQLKLTYKGKATNDAEVVSKNSQEFICNDE